MSDSEDSYNFEKTYELFKTIKKRRLKQTTAYSNGIKVIKDSDNQNAERMSDVIDKITNIGQILSNSIINPSKVMAKIMKRSAILSTTIVPIAFSTGILSYLAIDPALATSPKRGRAKFAR